MQAVKISPPINLSLNLALLVLLGCGCAATPTSRGGSDSLSQLRGGMNLEEVVRFLGPPTSRTTVRPDRMSPPFHELVYRDSPLGEEEIILRFEPGLAEIRINGELYRKFRNPETR